MFSLVKVGGGRSKPINLSTSILGEILDSRSIWITLDKEFALALSEIESK